MRRGQSALQEGDPFVIGAEYGRAAEAGGSLEPVELALGITDHAYTEVAAVVKGNLQTGDEVVTGSVVAVIGLALHPGSAGRGAR